MLDAFIIEEIKRRERLPEERPRPAVQLPLPEEKPKQKSDTQDGDPPKRGVVVIDLSV